MAGFSFLPLRLDDSDQIVRANSIPIPRIPRCSMGLDVFTYIWLNIMVVDFNVGIYSSPMEHIDAYI